MTHTKKHSYHLRLDDDGRAQLIALSSRLGLEGVEAVRYAIKLAHDLAVVVTPARYPPKRT